MCHCQINILPAKLAHPYLALHIPGKVAVGDVGELALGVIRVVDDVSVTVLIQPQLADNDVVHRSCHLPPSVVVT